MPTAYREPAANDLFHPQITALMRFACTTEDHACPTCGKVGRVFWTMLTPFCPVVVSGLELVPGEPQPALTLVCCDHPLAVAEEWRGAIGLDEDPPGEFDWSELEREDDWGEE